ncbi:MAG TPA: very short patch repair endonuclease [Propionicimonas sp.]|jgi:DNA mismatch endonuclease (patch repair protein)
MAGRFHVPAHPGSTSAPISRRMSVLRRRDNARELALRSALHRAGLRFRVCHPVPGLPRRSIDIAFTRVRLAVFLDGCFWHGCPHHGTRPRSNSSWWSAKLGANRARDHDTTAHLEAVGWRVVRIWEHVPLDDAVVTVMDAVAAARSQIEGRGSPRRHVSRVAG